MHKNIITFVLAVAFAFVGDAFVGDAEARVKTGTIAGCIHEDGSGQKGRCVWIGADFGNQTGRSYIVRKNKTVRYITHANARRVWSGTVPGGY